jgi:hypothetical protein
MVLIILPKEIRSDPDSREMGVWFVLGLTLRTVKYISPDPISFGIPDQWGAAACVYAWWKAWQVWWMGIPHTAVNFLRRFAARSISGSPLSASNGYVAYRYMLIPPHHLLPLNSLVREKPAPVISSSQKTPGS